MLRDQAEYPSGTGARLSAATDSSAPAGEPEDPHAEHFGPPDLEVSASARVAASPRDAWEAFETENLTVLGGDERRYEEHPLADGTVRRLGARLGLKGLGMQWEEQRYDFVAPEWLFIDRRHERGPLAREVFFQTFSPRAGGGTEVRITSQLWGRGRLSRGALRGARRALKQPLERAFRDLSAQLEARAAPGASGVATGLEIGPSPPPLSRRARRRLEAAKARLSSPEFAENLARFVASAPLWSQDRMQPRALARAWGLPEEEVVVGCLQAVREGALSLWFELLCPSCGGAKASAAALDETGREAHCPSCNIRFDAEFPNSVAVSFRPSPAIRDFEYEPQCIGSPQHAPRVLARVRLEPGEARCIAIDLRPGRYRIRDLRALEAARVDVTDDADADAVTVEIAEEGPYPAALGTRAGRSTIALRSRLSVPSWIVLESRSGGSEALTAAELLAMKDARAYLPESALGPSARVQVRSAAVLAAEVFGGAAERATRAIEEAAPPRVVSARGRHAVAVWDDPSGAVSAAAEVSALDGVCSAVSLGTVVAPAEGVAPGGPAVEEALAALDFAVPGLAALPARAVGEKSLEAALGASGLGASVIPGPRVAGREDCFLAFEEPGASGRRRGPAPGPGGSEPSLEGERVLGRYRVGPAIGRGGVGAIYAAEDERTGDAVVVKVFRALVARLPGAVQQCLNEARICSLLDHPNVVKFLDFGRGADDRPAIVMERLRGEELRERLRARGGLDSETVCRVGRDVAAGLEAAHAAGVVHRDVKPKNVMLTADSDPRAVLIDFGIALEERALEEFAADASETPRYASPEQLRREVPTPKSDLYGLGVTLYECLAGVLPGAASSGRDAEDLPPVESVAGGPVPAELAHVVNRAVVGDPDRRIESAAEVRAILEEALERDEARRERSRAPAELSAEAQSELSPERARGATR